MIPGMILLRYISRIIYFTFISKIKMHMCINIYIYMVPPKDLPCLTYIYIHIYIDMHICIHIYICIYIHIVLSVNLNHHFCLLKSSSTDSAMFRRMIQWSMEDGFPAPSLLDILRVLIVDCWCCMFIIYILYVYIYIFSIYIYIYSVYMFSIYIQYICIYYWV